MSETAARVHREPTDREREQARIIVGRITTAFGHKIPGGDDAARQSGEWVVNGFPWVRKDEAGWPQLDPEVEKRMNDDLAALADLRRRTEAEGRDIPLA